MPERPRPRPLITPALFSRPPHSPSPGEKGEQPLCYTPPAPRVTSGRAPVESRFPGNFLRGSFSEDIAEDIVLKIHEYQAKEILRRYGVATPRGKVTDSPDEAAKICEEMGGRCVVKAQIHAGGRGKGGGVKLAKS